MTPIDWRQVVRRATLKSRMRKQWAGRGSGRYHRGRFQRAITETAVSLQRASDSAQPEVWTECDGAT